MYAMSGGTIPHAHIYPNMMDTSSRSTGRWTLFASMRWSLQTSPHIENFLRQAERQCILSEFAGLNAVCRFESLDCQVLPADIYHKVTFDEG